ncbi:hypothetical protein F5Y01DRAFT_321540 [Xylaria sp. FL0043]|nr:hypothetical protein F5Y01DRAFT_321540 [Xylaria sp. FL0043]
MPWTQQGTCWRRPLNCDELMFKSMASAGRHHAREQSVLCGTVRIAFTPDTTHVEQRLRSAWATLRLRYPDVAVVLVDNEKVYQPITSPDDLETWVASTFHVETAVKSADELFSRHVTLPVESASCYWVSASSELAIVSSHWRWDGRGHMMILHEFLSLLTAPELDTTSHGPGSEAAQLVPSLDEVLNVPHPPLSEWLTRADTLLAPMMEGHSSIGLPATVGSLPGDTLRIETVIPHEATSALRAGCRARGIRLTAALHTSLIATTAYYYQRDVDHSTKYKSWAAFDLRKYCPAPFHGPLHGPSVRMIGWPLVVDATDDWDSLAKRIQSVYEQSFAPEDSDLMFVRAPYMEQMTRMLMAMMTAATEATPATEPVLSNLGVLDDYVQAQYGDVAVRNVWLGVHMLIPQLGVYTWSWQGCLHISISYNESFYQAAFVKEWLEKVKVNLFTNLEVAYSPN